MVFSPRPLHSLGMGERRRVELLLVIDLGSEPMTGTLRTASGFEHPFEGVLSLLAAIDAVCTPAPGHRRIDEPGADG